jgi:site-specific recombinase XerD
MDLSFGPYDHYRATVFVTEGGTPVTPAWFLRMVQRTGKAAKLPFRVHPHMLRHSTGYKLANDGQDTHPVLPVSDRTGLSGFLTT